MHVPIANETRTEMLYMYVAVTSVYLLNNDTFEFDPKNTYSLMNERKGLLKVTESWEQG